MKRGFFFSALVFFGLYAFKTTNKCSLTIEIMGLKTDKKGNLRIGVFDKSGFPKAEKALYGKIVAVKNEKMTVTLENISPGKYAVAIVQDQDKNGKLSTNLVGYPTEPYGFSNNKFGTFGPPAFESVTITLKSEFDTKINIHLK